MAKQYKHSQFKLLILLLHCFSITLLSSDCLAQSVNENNIDKYAIINSDFDDLFNKDYSNYKTLEFSIKGINSKEDAERLKSNFLAFGGVIKCIFNEADGSNNVYNINLLLYEKAHQNYFLKMLVTNNILYTMYKGVLQPTENLRITGKFKNK